VILCWREEISIWVCCWS